MLQEAVFEMDTTLIHRVEQAVHLLSRTRSPALVLDRLLRLLGESLEARGGALVLTDEAPPPLQGCSWGEFQPQIVDVARELCDGMRGQTPATARHTALPRASGMPAIEGLILAAPIRSGQQLLGIIVLFCHARSSSQVRTALAGLNISASCLGLYLQNTSLQRHVRELNASPGPEPPLHYDPEHILGNSAPMQAVLRQVEQAARSRSTVLLRGESGTGKELIARALHKQSVRRQQAFVKLNCAALPESLLESELFGHERGAFTGATKMRRGRFEMADKGTLFLDEIGDISAAIQVKLLRVLQERTFERVGGNRSITVDVRIIAATNINLEEAVRRRHFREDLYYRLHVVPITLPPLRERREDIPLLVGSFLQRFNAENHKQLKISSAAMDLIVGYDWPGNVRELENCIERMVVMAQRDVIAPEEVPLPVKLYGPAVTPATAPAEVRVPSLTRTIADLERQRLIEALQQSGGVQTRAAALLGITPRQLGYKVKKYHIDPKRLLRAPLP